MCDDNGDTFIATFHNIILEPDLCEGLFSIIKLMNLGHTCLFHKGFYMVYLGDKENNLVNFPHSAQRKHAFWGGVTQMSKTNKLTPRNKVALEFLKQRLGHRSTRSLMAVDTANVWENIELIIDPDPFFKSYHISSMKIKARSKSPLNPKAPSK